MAGTFEHENVLGRKLCTSFTQLGFCVCASQVGRGPRQSFQCVRVLHSPRGHEGRSSILWDSWITVDCTGTVVRLVQDLNSLQEAGEAHGLRR
jgi:hypothetical protein